MNFEKNKGTTSHGEETNKTAENGEIITVKRQIRGFDSSIKLSRVEKPFSLDFDLQKKTIAIELTPDALAKGISTLNEILMQANNAQEGDQTILSVWGRKLEAINKRFDDKRDAETVSIYAKQNGQTEQEVINEILDEIDKKSTS